MYSYRYEKEGSTITNCFPEDDETTMWLKSSSNLQEVIEAAKEKWPDVQFEDISIDAVHHHQYSIYYDLHDNSDYVDYIVLNV
jgi:hypothetical protein